MVQQFQFCKLFTPFNGVHNNLFELYQIKVEMARTDFIKTSNFNYFSCLLQENSF